MALPPHFRIARRQSELLSAQLSGLIRRLAEVTASFFAAKLGLNPGRVNVLEQEGGNFVVIKVEGFMSKAEVALAERPEDDRALRAYYTRVLERLSPMLGVVVEEGAKRPLLECRMVLDLSRDECLYLLTLGTGERKGSVSVQNQETNEER